ncbi:hypothetical protein ERO13_D11G234350v2 [Gossypium hirsutum]|uniref:Uncharacterized protein n=2 Tax=Gossypium TaxID=3633 RepID=A0A5D2SYV3_GOSMU|nr:hypothetical protein ERO13_D11G234350v2 [Gossypium hirsutum]TYH45473.1 hypothetical protein ES332_D11G267400v1 [Gossypium tomentosum]TYI57144.1 hypothetical protein E1A91_D11G259300v1 [Gossypium mustelinum]
MAENRMHALQYNSYGGGAAALKHVEVPIPTPNKGEILLKLDCRLVCRLVCRLFYNLTNKIIDWFVDLLIQNG